MEEYEQLLQKAQEELPVVGKSSERFMVEKVLGHIEGNKTVISNLKKIARRFNRVEQHLMKYLLRELATPGKLIGERLILGTKVAASKINKKLKQYASEFVFCSECGKPDTQLVMEKGMTFLKCLACGIKKTVKNM